MYTGVRSHNHATAERRGRTLYALAPLLNWFRAVDLLHGETEFQTYNKHDGPRTRYLALLKVLVFLIYFFFLSQCFQRQYRLATREYRRIDEKNNV